VLHASAADLWSTGICAEKALDECNKTNAVANIGYRTSVVAINGPSFAKTSIVIPSYNRPEQLRRCLRSLALLNDRNFNIVVVDDGSTEPLSNVCAEFGDRVHYVRQVNRGPASARNTGVGSTSAEFIAFTDDDCQPHAEWLTSLRAAHGGRQERLVGGKVVNALQGNRYSEASQLLVDFLYSYYDAGTGSSPFFASNNLACSRLAFERMGGFDESFPLAAAEDRDFGMRWRDAGGQLVYAPEAVVDHAHELSLRKFWRQHANYGAGARHLHDVLKARNSPSIGIENIKFYLSLVTYPIKGGNPSKLPEAALMVLSQLAMVYGYMSTGRSEKGAKPRPSGDLASPAPTDSTPRKASAR
jgi:GT2 family glycosyltransferase